MNEMNQEIKNAASTGDLETVKMINDYALNWASRCI